MQELPGPAIQHAAIHFGRFSRTSRWQRQRRCAEAAGQPMKRFQPEPLLPNMQ